MKLHVITNGDPIRKNNVKKALDCYSIPFTFHEYKRNKTNGKLGCFMSHIELYRYARYHKKEYIWIAEDNITNAYEYTTNTIWNDIQTFIKKERQWYILFIGGWFQHVVSYEKTDYPRICKTNSLHGLSCYMIHERFYNLVLDQYEAHTTNDIDCYLQSLSTNRAYILYPILFYRDCSIVSTNTQNVPNTYINLWRSFYHQPVLLRLQEWMIYNGMMNYTTNSIILLVLLFLLYYIGRIIYTVFSQKPVPKMVR